MKNFIILYFVDNKFDIKFTIVDDAIIYSFHFILFFVTKIHFLHFMK